MNLALTLLNKYWLHALAFAAGVAITAWAGFIVYDARVAKLKSQKDQAVLAENLRLTTEYNQQKAQTDELNRTNHRRIADLDIRLAAAKRLRPNTCIPITSAATGGDAAQAPGAVHGSSGSVGAHDLLDLGHDADQVVIDQNTCVDFLDVIYKTHSP